MSLAVRIANALGQLIIGEPVSPLLWPCEHWKLRAPRQEATVDASSLILTVRDIRYPRLKGEVSLMRLQNGRVYLNWKTRAGGGSIAVDRPIRISTDGHLYAALVVGQLCCSTEEMEFVMDFIQRTGRFDKDNGDDPVVMAPHNPTRPPGGLSNAARPNE